MIDFRDFTLHELTNYINTINGANFRAKQIFKWINKGIDNIDDMTDLPFNLKERLKNDGYISNMDIEAKFESKHDGTLKYLMKLKDSNIIECVLMEYTYGYTICISTQVGCSMGCSFCASTIGGKSRDLLAGELLGQVLKVQSDSKFKISNIVLMGTGEPFDNFENVIKFLSIVNHEDGLNIGMRHITISTCGLVPEIKKFADLNLQVTLAISLHGSNDEIRKKIMPVAYKYSMEELFDAIFYYTKKTNKRITFEYAVIKGLNDDECYGYELLRKLKGLLCHVNLIPLNKVDEKSYEKPQNEKIERLKNILISGGIETTIRRELGSDINAACGQLRRKFTKNEL